MNAEQYHAFLDQLSISAGNGEAWRYMLVLCSIPAVALWIGIRLMPESARSWQDEYLADPAYLDGILADGAARARSVASATLRDVYDKVGFLAPGR